jgi:tight adherence protein B
VPSISQRAICAEHRIAELTAAIWRLAEQTGAPAADLVERIEADARGADRAKASAAAQAAGAKATALLLAALPLGGIALGYGIGADPLHVLLRTPLGGACAATAVLLQCAGLLWADRLANGPTR